MSRGDVRWTNPSVRRFAGNRDPVQAIVDRARDLTLRAMDEGWPGPPFDPSELAKWLNLDVIPCADIRDARIVPKPDLGLSIEFNPNRSRGRVRYSIAHEIAHSLFPDAPKQFETARIGTSKWAMSGSSRCYATSPQQRF